MWVKKAIGLGAIKSGSKNIIHFVHEGDIDIEVGTITSPCSCTEVVWDKNTKTMTITYVPKDIPEHIKNMNRNNYNDVKQIQFKYINGDTKELETLTITAQVFDKLPNSVRK